MFPQTELMPRNSSNGGAQRASSSTTALYEARNCRYLSALPETTMQARQTCTKCFLGSKDKKRKMGKTLRVPQAEPKEADRAKGFV